MLKRLLRRMPLARPADNLAIYVSLRDVFTPEFVAASAPGARVDVAPGAEDGGWRQITVSWPEAQLELNRMCAGSEELSAQLDSLVGYVHHWIGGRMDQTAWNLIQKILKTKHLIGAVMRPGFQDPVYDAVIYEIVAAMNAIVLMSSGVYDAMLRLYLGPEGARDPAATIPDLPSAVERRAHTQEALRRWGVPVAASLPPVVADEEVVLRTAGAVTGRASALWGVACRGALLQQGAAVPPERPGPHASQEETAFLADPAPDPAVATRFLWRYEALATLLWAQGLVAELGPLTGPADWNAADVIMRATDDRVTGRPLRPAAEILDQLDLAYRCHWAVTEAARTGCSEPPANLNADVVLERHVALNWLTCYQWQDWGRHQPRHLTWSLATTPGNSPPARTSPSRPRC
jgi:Domain of unknown function (DUF4272)